MADLRVTQSADSPRQVASVTPDGGRGDEGPQREAAKRGRGDTQAGSEELAVALSLEGSLAIEARYEYDGEGDLLIHIVDKEHGETIAVLTPEELKTLAEQTGLPPGLLVQTST
ncbi:MAG: hypothetical protein V3S31_05490 [Dehalococcoidia bacterium]